ncbi:MAG: diaminopimelate decarboxylase [Microbacteriaceae bacterium]|nr:diaminopimelate decarboxylase [Microbacteriaceae bacterium]MDR9443787.1 diaminopimelate decarboxylase [Microbacteriaceae bacterium]
MKNSLAPEWLQTPQDLNLLSEKIWPASAKRDGSGEIQIGGVGVGELASKYGTPLYVIDEDDFRSRLNYLSRSFNQPAREHGISVRMYYAAKALLTTDIARWIKQEDYSIDVASGGELAVALAAGFEGSKIGLHGNNKSLSEISRAVSNGVNSIVIDSELEIERIASIAESNSVVQGVRLRVNSGVHASTHEFLATAREDQKFGIPLEQVESLVETIRSHSSLKFLGLHSHIGSQIFVVDGFIEAARRLLQLHAKLSETSEVPELNLGGGFGIAYVENDKPLNIKELAQRIISNVAGLSKELGINPPNLCFEPGRVIAGPSGITLYNVGTIKDVEVGSETGSSVRRYVSVDGGMSDNLRSSLYGAEYSASLASRATAAEPVLSRVVGKHCESGDIVVNHTYLPSDLAINELIAVPATGAYCFSLASNYNYLGRPPMASVKAGESRLLVRGETEQDMLARDEGYRTGLIDES